MEPRDRARATAYPAGAAVKFSYLDSAPAVPASVFQWARRLITDLNANFYGGPPIGSALLFVGDTPANYLDADGATFDADLYPVLAEALGGNTLPNWTAPSGGKYAVKAR